MRKLLAVSFIFALCFLLYTTPASADAQLVTNGGFESGDFTGWTLSGNTANPDIFFGVDNFDANSGNFGAFLGAIGSPLTLSETLNTTAGDNLVVSFAVAQNLDTADPTGSVNTFVAMLDGSTLLSLSNPVQAGAFLIYTFDLTAPSSSFVLSFTSQNDSDFWSLDDVSVTAPEPSSLLMLATALPGLFFIRRRRAA
ncbi:MAG: PEP-CTERM sorting domain-containing protein [Candidatus Acidiferrales bacterium]